MRFAAIALATCLLTPVVVTAQPRAGRRIVAPRKSRPPAKPNPKDDTPKTNPKDDANYKKCQARKELIESDSSKVNEMSANLAGIEAEIAGLWLQMQRLDDQKARLIEKIARSETLISIDKKGYDQECSKSEDCGQYEKWVTDLVNRTKPLETELDEVTKDISGTRAKVGVLRRRIEPLRKEYTNLQCNKMVAGQTKQSTIDRCSDIFSEWNRLQAKLNDYNNRLPSLRSKQRQLARALQNSEKRAKGYETYLAKNCKKSKSIGQTKRFSTVRQRADRLSNELDDLVKDVTSLRQLRISVD